MWEFGDAVLHAHVLCARVIIWLNHQRVRKMSTLEELRRTFQGMENNLYNRLVSMNERVVIMVDRNNLGQIWHKTEISNNRPDFMKLKEILTRGRFCRQARCYYSDFPGHLLSDADRFEWQKRQDFYYFLKSNGWFIRNVPKVMQDGIFVEKGLDGILTRDMDNICRNGYCDTVVLVSGNAGYCDVVGDVQDRYCVKVEVAFFGGQTSRELREKATSFIDLNCERSNISRVPNC